MSKKTLMVLIVVLAALCAALVMTGERQSGARAPAAAEHLLSGVDLSTVRSVTLADNTATTRLAQAEGVWTVAEQENYAADLDRLRELLRALDAEARARHADVTETGTPEEDEAMPHYFTMLKQLAIFGFFTSKVGATGVLQYVAVPGRYEGDLAYVPGTPAWGTS